MKTRKFSNRSILIVLVIACAVVLIASFTYASYTSVNTAKRVVSTSSFSDQLFSSNYLSLRDKDQMTQGSSSSVYSPSIIRVTDGTEKQAVFISVCNYAQGYTAKWCDELISYDIYFKLVNPTTMEPITDSEILAKNYTASVGTSQSGGSVIGAEGVVFKNQKLVPSTEAGVRNIYTVVLDTEYENEVAVLAEVYTNSATVAYKESGLGGMLMLSTYAGEVASGWQGAFADPQNVAPKEYAGFNYEVSGVGKGKVTLTWDKDKVEVSPIFYQEMFEYITQKTENSMTFEVGKDSEDTFFAIQFYRTAEAADTEEWSTVNNYVKFQFTPTEAGE